MFLERIKSFGSRMILEGIQEDLLNDPEMNGHIHDDHCVPTGSLLVSGSRASH